MNVNLGRLFDEITAKKWPEYHDQSLITLANWGCEYFDFFTHRIHAYHASQEASETAFQDAVLHNVPYVLFHILKARRCDFFGTKIDGIPLIYSGLNTAIYRGYSICEQMIVSRLKYWHKHPKKHRGPIPQAYIAFIDTWDTHPGYDMETIKKEKQQGFPWKNYEEFDKKMHSVYQDIKGI